MARTKKKASDHFLTITTCGNRTYLTPLPGQTLRKEPLTEGITVRGCEKIWKGSPPGTIFGTTTLHKAHRKSSEFYETNDLYPMGEDNREYSIFEAAARNRLIEEYQILQTRKQQTPA